MFYVGDHIGDYEIVANLKAGGMATLYLGRRAGAAGFAKHVAIKVIHEHLACDAQFVQMFVDEALLSARIHHPNVVHVEELAELDGTYFLVMEFVYGCSLAQLLGALGRRKRRMSPELATYVAIKVADGLHAAHEIRDPQGQLLNVVHRDVNPQNVLLAYQGNVKLIDFGVAKARGRALQTEGGSIKGKFRYMSPEQACAQALDRRADVYALGVVLWETLTMRRRFDGESDASVIHRVQNPDVVPPSRYVPSVSPALDAVVLKATAANPDDRYATTHELRDALVDAMPHAAALHESVLGTLLTAVMAEHIETEKESLPPSMAGMSVEVPASVVAEHTVHELTLSATDVQLLADGSSAEPDLLEAATRIFPTLEELDDPATIVQVGLPSSMPPSMGGAVAPAIDLDVLQAPSIPASMPPAQSAVPPFVWAIAGGAVVLGLVLGVVTVLGVVGSEDDEASRGADAIAAPVTVAIPAAPLARPADPGALGADAGAARDLVVSGDTASDITGSDDTGSDDVTAADDTGDAEPTVRTPRVEDGRAARGGRTRPAGGSASRPSRGGGRRHGRHLIADEF